MKDTCFETSRVGMTPENTGFYQFLQGSCSPPRSFHSHQCHHCYTFQSDMARSSRRRHSQRGKWNMRSLRLVTTFRLRIRCKMAPRRLRRSPGCKKRSHPGGRALKRPTHCQTVSCRRNIPDKKKWSCEGQKMWPGQRDIFLTGRCRKKTNRWNRCTFQVGKRCNGNQLRYILLPHSLCSPWASRDLQLKCRS
jgi:hypothetical protein